LNNRQIGYINIELIFVQDEPPGLVSDEDDSDRPHALKDESDDELPELETDEEDEDEPPGLLVCARTEKEWGVD
jgi:hypothetical protein